MRYKQIYEGDTVKPVMKGYRMECCGCGLVHLLDFHVIKHGRGHKVTFEAWSDRGYKKKRKWVPSFIPKPWPVSALNFPRLPTNPDCDLINRMASKSKSPKFPFKDGFNGNNRLLKECIRSLIELDAKNCPGS